jgi:hypothetical protein
MSVPHVLSEETETRIELGLSLCAEESLFLPHDRKGVQSR